MEHLADEETIQSLDEAEQINFDHNFNEDVDTPEKDELKAISPPKQSRREQIESISPTKVSRRD